MKFSVAASLFWFGALALSLRPVIRDYSDPDGPYSQYRIAYNGDTSVTVSWNSATEIKDPIVCIGQTPELLLECSAPGTSTIYATAITYDNHVTVNNLRPFTKYYYRVTALADWFELFGPAETEFYFTTARAAGDHTGFTIAAFGDLGNLVGDSASTAEMPATFNSLIEN